MRQEFRNRWTLFFGWEKLERKDFFKVYAFLNSFEKMGPNQFKNFATFVIFTFNFIL